MAASLRNSILLCGGVLFFCGIAQAAEQFIDPTRPAFELVPGLSVDGVAGDTSEKAVPPPVGLQSVVISAKREAAIINGKEVELGQKLGDAVLTVVNETCVVLVGPQGRQVMYMFPAVSMKKNEQACLDRHGVKSVGAVAKGNRSTGVNNKNLRAKNHADVSISEEIKDGSNK